MGRRRKVRSGVFTSMGTLASRSFLHIGSLTTRQSRKPSRYGSGMATI